MVTQLAQHYGLDSRLDRSLDSKLQADVTYDFNPDDAHEPGTQSYPNQPNGPKMAYPKDAYLQDVTYTVPVIPSKDNMRNCQRDGVPKGTMETFIDP